MFCQACDLSVRESLWANHTKLKSHLDRLEKWRSQQPDDSTSQVSEKRDESGTESDSSAGSYSPGKLVHVQMPEVPVYKVAALDPLEEVTALDFEQGVTGSVMEEFEAEIAALDTSETVLEGVILEQRKIELQECIDEAMKRGRHEDVISNSEDDEENDWKKFRI